MGNTMYYGREAEMQICKINEKMENDAAKCTVERKRESTNM